ncbi:ParA family protein [Natranaerobius thermophilus]|uniref:Cobyrinic acid ac-diamide synthase n=1 Tax=Natranaerobius thermophilus (strain ATCC BAA-1301 / DSM 18059 / JW/NM-WN-LF) TaxID=457570 RepID=B2A8N4_NATTJ|nr:ParA family protein [Natranaerobius thermophilus]ACB86483.1 Cobyrinic acid ac-diamide synthase [Natranaerobius thermophilus JW/NM-WN-LF]
MGTTISFGIQKGGVGKTTTTAITSYILSKEHKTLAVDFDSQGNLTRFLTQQNIYNFTEKTVLEAVKAKDPRPYIYKISDNLHILPAEDFLATFSRFLYQEYQGNKALLLKETLDVVREQYNYITIDLPPHLGDQTINGLSASDYAVVLLQSEPFALDALDRYLEVLMGVQKKANSNMKLIGILSTMLDSRAAIDSEIINKARKDYEDVVFETIIRRRNRIKEFSLFGIEERTKVDREALKYYKNFTKELISRVQKKGN